MNDILLSIESVIGSSTKSTKDERLFICPFCYHHKPKLSINFGRRIGFWKCWVCDESGKRFSTLLYRLGYSRKEIKDVLQDMKIFLIRKNIKKRLEKYPYLENINLFGDQMAVLNILMLLNFLKIVV